MIKPSQFLGAACVAAAAFPVLAQAPQDAMQRVEVRRHLPVDQACPDVYTSLQAALNRVAYELDTPAEMLVEFKLDGDRVSDVSAKGTYWAYGAPLRQAVRQLACHGPDAGAYAVRFRVVFDYTDQPGAPGTAAMLPPDFAPAMVRR